MADRLNFEDVEIGQQWISEKRTVTEADVVNFANITGDFNPLHVDHEFAKASQFGQPIAHGLLGMSWVAGLGSTCPCMNTMAFVGVRDWKFLRPLFFGDTVHVETTVIDKQPKGRRAGLVAWQLKLFNHRGELTQSGIFDTLVHCATAKQKEKPGEAASSDEND